MKKYICTVCGYIHDEKKGAWDKLPADWCCPVCGAAKDSFELVVESPKTNEKKKLPWAKVVIVGSGIGGITLAEELHSKNKNIKITMVTQESDGHYYRPLLSHGFSDPFIAQKIMMKPFGDYMKEGIDVRFSSRVMAIDAQSKKIDFYNDYGKKITEKYDLLVLATGSEALIPPHLQKFEGQFSTLNSLNDLNVLLSKRHGLIVNGKVPRWAIIGGGFIGCEVASDLRFAGDQVDLYHKADRLLERTLTAGQSTQLQNHFHKNGINLFLSQNISGLRKKDDYFILQKDGQDSPDLCDIVLLAVGFKPRLELAQSAGLVIKRGIVTNKFLQSSDPSIFILGDTAEVEGKTYPFVAPIRSQAVWLAEYLLQTNDNPWMPSTQKVIYKIHDLELTSN